MPRIPNSSKRHRSVPRMYSHLDRRMVPFCTCDQFFRSKICGAIRSDRPGLWDRTPWGAPTRIGSASSALCWVPRSNPKIQWGPWSAAGPPQGQAGAPTLKVQVCSNKQVPSDSSNNLAAYHIWPVLAHGLNPPPNGPLPCHRPDADLRSPSTGWTWCRKIHIVAEAIMWVRLQLNLRLGQQQHVKTPAFHRPDGLCQTKCDLSVQCCL